MNIITDIKGETTKGFNNIIGECQGRKVIYKPITAKGNNSCESWVFADTGEVVDNFCLETEGGII